MDVSGPQSGNSRGFGEWLSESLDWLVLAMAVAGVENQLGLLNPQYADGVLLVLDEYHRRAAGDPELSQTTRQGRGHPGQPGVKG